MADSIQLGAIGVVFQVGLTKKSDGSQIAPSSFTTIQIVFRKPSGVVMIKSASIETNVWIADVFHAEVLKYTTVAGDLDTIGGWQVKGRVASATQDFSSNWENFLVEEWG